MYQSCLSAFLLLHENVEQPSNVHDVWRPIPDSEPIVIPHGIRMGHSGSMGFAWVRVKPTLGSEWAQWVNPSESRTGPGRARYLGCIKGTTGGPKCTIPIPMLSIMIKLGSSRGTPL